MSSAKIYTSQEFQSLQSTHYCPRCQQQQDTYVQLGCSHKFCVLCITFMYLKFKNILQNKRQIKCLQCDKISQLNQEIYELISQTINKELGPIIKNESENNQSRMSINQTNLGFSNQQKQNPHVKNNIKSEQASLFVNGGATPSKNSKYFYSKCQSPQNSSINTQSDSCPIHSTEDISYICMTCDIQPLCYKCIKSNKHSNHDVKIYKKAVQIINEKLSLMNLETVQKIQNIELYQKRLYDRKLIFQQRVQKSMKQIKNIFQNLQKKITQKTTEILNDYQKFYQAKIQEIQSKSQQSSQILKNIQLFQQKLQQFTISTESSNKKNSSMKASKFVQKYEQIQLKREQIFSQKISQSILSQNNNKVLHIYETILDPFHYQNSELSKFIFKLTELIQGLSLQNLLQTTKNEKQRFNQTIPFTSIMKSDILFNKNKTLGLRNCSSRQKLHISKQANNYYEQTYGKRIKTNVPMSLNTSRDKRQKKHNTKTEQDERRLKSKANYKTQANTQGRNVVNSQKTNNKQLPSYITKCIQKHQMISSIGRKVSPFNSGTVYLMQNIHNSKNNSKIISKTSNILNNDDLNNRRKNKDTIQMQFNKDKKNHPEIKNGLKSAKHQAQILKKKR